MSKHAIFLSAIIFQIALCTSWSSAHADIGAIGSPNVIVSTPLNDNSVESDPASTPVTAPAIPGIGDITTGTPIYTMSLRQKSFTDFLRNLSPKNISIAYTIVSYIPVDTGMRKTKSLNDEANDTVNTLTKEMRAHGVAANNIHTLTKPAPEGDGAGEIKIFAQ